MTDLPTRLRKLASVYEHYKPHSDEFCNARALVMGIIRELIGDWL